MADTNCVYSTVESTSCSPAFSPGHCSRTAQSVDDTSGSETSRKLPLKKRYRPVHHGDTERSSSNSTPEDEYPCSEVPISDPALSHSTDTFHSQCITSANVSPVIDTVSNLSLESPPSGLFPSSDMSSVHDAGPGSSSDATESGGARSRRSKSGIPDNLKNFFPESLYSLFDERRAEQEAKSSSRRKKKHRFVYCINNQPMSKLPRKFTAPSTSACEDSSVLSNSESPEPSVSTQLEVDCVPLDPSPAYPTPSSSSVIRPTPTTLMKPRPEYFPMAMSNHLLAGDLLHQAPPPLQNFHPFFLSSPNYIYHMPMFPPPPPPSSEAALEGGILQDQVHAVQKKKQPQKCRYCSNHDLDAPVKGHKHECTFRDCTCDSCEITRRRREAVRAQANLTRKQNRSKES